MQGANTALLAVAALTFSFGSPIAALVTSIAGAITAVAWYLVDKSSTFFALRWHKDMEALIASDAYLETWVRGRNMTTPRLERPWPARRARRIYASVSVAMFVVWSSLLATAVTGLVTGELPVTPKAD